MEYIIHKDPGPEAIRVAENAFKGLGNVDEIIFSANQIDSLGKYIPDSRCVIIDLEQVVRNRDLTLLKGMFLHLAIWCNLVYAIYHEAAHARTFQQEGWLLIPNPEEWEINTELLEAEARKEATNNTALWFIDHEIPPVKDMGWLGERIAEHMNYFFAAGNLLMEEEVRLMGTPAAGRADLFVKLNGTFDEMQERLLFDRIDEGKFGYLNNHTRYLRVNEIICGNEEAV